jgi:YHS domain-containing protein
MRALQRSILGFSLGWLLLATAGCDRYRQQVDTGLVESEFAKTLSSRGLARERQIDSSDPEHLHRSSVLGGFLASFAGDQHHAELVVENGGQLRIYFMTEDDSELAAVPAQFLTGYFKPLNGSRSRAILFMPEPLEYDQDGWTSRLVGSLAMTEDGVAANSAGLPAGEGYLLLPGLAVSTEHEQRYMLRFRIDADADRFAGFPGHAAMFEHLASQPHGVSGNGSSKHGSAEAAVAASVSDPLRELYTTPGGKYTQADIDANRGRTAVEAFPGFRPQHDPNPQVGDPICPITRTKANAACSWTIDGQSYSFCCPPCIDEFVAKAKQQPQEIQRSEEYRQRAE